MNQPASQNNDHLAAQHGMGRKLIEEGIATPAQLSEALSAAASGGHILQHLVEAGHLSPGDAHDFLSKQPGIAGIDVSQYVVERGLAQMIPAELARERQVMPIDALGKLLTVAMAYPVDTGTIAEVESLTGRRVKAVLCRAADLTAAIKKQYADEDEGPSSGFEDLNLGAAPQTQRGGPAKTDVVQKLRAIDTLPIPMSALQKCDALWGQDAPSVTDVCDFVSEQPSLAAGALRAANSEAFGLRGQVSSIPLACSILGAATVRAITMDAGHGGGKLDLEAHALDAVACAKACAETARALGRQEVAQLYAAGLLHAVGRVALAQIEPEFYASAKKLSHAELAKQEVQRFGLSFAEAGFEVLDAWGVAPALAGTIRDQTNPASSESFRETAALLASSHYLAIANQTGGKNPALHPQIAPVFEIVGLAPAKAQAILDSIKG